MFFVFKMEVPLAMQKETVQNKNLKSRSKVRNLVLERTPMGIIG